VNCLAVDHRAAHEVAARRDRPRGPRRAIRLLGKARDPLEGQTGQTHLSAGSRWGHHSDFVDQDVERLRLVKHHRLLEGGRADLGVQGSGDRLFEEAPSRVICSQAYSSSHTLLSTTSASRLYTASGGGKLALVGGFFETLSGAGRDAPADRRQAAVSDKSVSHEPSELTFCLTTASHNTATFGHSYAMRSKFSGSRSSPYCSVQPRMKSAKSLNCQRPPRGAEGSGACRRSAMWARVAGWIVPSTWT
jgi:hypothetical protein